MAPAVGFACKPGVARRQLTFFLRRQKESKQRKRRPDGLGPLRFATGQPAVLDKSGVSLELAFGSDNREP